MKTRKILFITSLVVMLIGSAFASDVILTAVNPAGDKSAVEFAILTLSLFTGSVIIHFGMPYGIVAAYPQPTSRYPMRKILPQDKLAYTTDRVGMPGVKYMQGTTRWLFDMVVIDGRTSFSFFTNQGGTHNFPTSNLGGDNKLNAGEAIEIQYICFLAATSVGTYPAYTAVSLVQSLQAVAATQPAFSGIFTLLIANEKKIKDEPLSAMQSFANPYSSFANNDIKILETPITLFPQVAFEVQVQTGTFAAAANINLYCLIGGAASLVNPKINS